MNYPSWVLLEDKSQIREAILYLQKELKPLQGLKSSDITVSFIAFKHNEECSYGFIKGSDFFETSVFDQIYEDPGCRPRKVGIFDHEHPNDPWALKDDNNI